MLKLIRVWLPAALCVGGIAVIGLGGVSDTALYTGIPIFSAGASVWLLNFLYRVGVSGDRERDTEAAAREYFAEHGAWPADRGPGRGAAGASR